LPFFQEIYFAKSLLQTLDKREREREREREHGWRFETTVFSISFKGDSMISSIRQIFVQWVKRFARISNLRLLCLTMLADGYQRESLVITQQSLRKDSRGMWTCSLAGEVTYVSANAPKWKITSPANLAAIAGAKTTLSVRKPAGVKSYVTLHYWDPLATNPADPSTSGGWPSILAVYQTAVGI